MENVELLYLKKSRRALIGQRNKLEIRVKEVNKEIKKIDWKMQVLIGRKSKKAKINRIPTYYAALGWKEKILYILKRSDLNLQEIVTAIMSREEHLDEAMVYRTVQRNLLRLTNTFLITKTREYKGKYKLKA